MTHDGGGTHWALLCAVLAGAAVGCKGTSSADAKGGTVQPAAAGQPPSSGSPSPGSPSPGSPAPAGQPAPAAQPGQIAGGLFLILSCAVTNYDQASSTQTAIGCNVENNDGSPFTGTVAGLSASVYAKGQAAAVAGAATTASQGSTYQISVVVPGLAPTDATTITLNGTFNGKAQQLSGILSHDLQFTTGPMDLYVDAAASASNAFCTKEAPCTSINKALSLVPQALYDPVVVHIAAGDYHEAINISGKTAGGATGTGGLALVGEASGFTETAADCNTGAGAASCFHLVNAAGQPDVLDGINVSGFINQSSGATVFNLRNARITGGGNGLGTITNGVVIQFQTAAALQNVTIENVAGAAIAADSSTYMQLNSSSTLPLPITITHPGVEGIYVGFGAEVDFNGDLVITGNTGAPGTDGISGIVVDGGQAVTTSNREVRFAATLPSHITINFDDSSAGIGVEAQNGGNFTLYEYDATAANAGQSTLTIAGPSIQGIAALANSGVTLERATVAITGLTGLQAQEGGYISVETALGAPAAQWLDLSLFFPTPFADGWGGLAIYALEAGKVFLNGNVKVHLCAPAASASQALDDDGTNVKPVVLLESSSALSALFNSTFGITADATPCATSAANQVNAVALDGSTAAGIASSSDSFNSSNQLEAGDSLLYVAP